MDTLHVSKADIPDYLQASAFLHTWDDTEELVAIHASVLKMDTLILSLADLDHLLRTLRFWIVCDIPFSVFDFVMGGREELYEEALLEFSQDLPAAASLLKIIQAPESNRWDVALQVGDQNTLIYMYEHGMADLDADCCSVATAVGAVDILHIPHQAWQPWFVNLPRMAVQNGRINCLHYLLCAKCPLDCNVSYTATRYGQFECLRRLHER